MAYIKRLQQTSRRIGNYGSLKELWNILAYIKKLEWTSEKKETLWHPDGDVVHCCLNWGDWSGQLERILWQPGRAEEHCCLHKGGWSQCPEGVNEKDNCLHMLYRQKFDILIFLPYASLKNNNKIFFLDQLVSMVDLLLQGWQQTTRQLIHKTAWPTPAAAVIWW